MVLSNKKLKQKLRAQLAESLASSVAGSKVIVDGGEGPGQKSQPPSLKELLGSATQRPRFSKREKRREALAVGTKDGEQNEVEEGKEENGFESLEKTKEKKGKRKRKRDAAEEQNGIMESKKKTNKKSKNKQAKNEEETKKGSLVGRGEQRVSETTSNFDSQANKDDTTKVYVGGIPYYSTEDDIRSFFESCGTITGVDCMTFPESGKFRGIAILSFKTDAAAKRALAMDGADMGGLFLKIQPYKATRSNKASDFSPAIVEGYNRIYVGNLSWDITEAELRKLFVDCSVSSIRFGMDKETQQFRGYAHVDFADKESLAMALKLDQEIVCGRPVKIRCAVPLRKPEKPSECVVAEEVADNKLSSSVPAKIRRRTCYECGEKGHLSSDCPKKQTETADSTLKE